MHIPKFVKDVAKAAAITAAAAAVQAYVASKVDEYLENRKNSKKN